MTEKSRTEIQDFIETMLESREEDFLKIQTANESYEAIVRYIKQLQKNPQKFAQVFQTDSQGFFTGFALGARIRKKEHLRLSVFFLDRTISGTKSKINAQASRVRVNPLSATATSIKSYQIRIYFDAPKEIKTNPKTYNKWFAANLENLLANNFIKSSYVHEFIHVQDFKRLDPSFLLHRSQKKYQEKERQQQSGEKTRDFSLYANDPLELNAYFSQAISDIQSQLRNAKTAAEKRQILGRNAQEFVYKFMSDYLKKQVRKNIDPDNWKRLAKRAATSWELLNEVQA